MIFRPNKLRRYLLVSKFHSMVLGVQQRLAVFYNIGFAAIYLRYKVYKAVFGCQILDKIVGVAGKLPEIIKNLLYDQDNKHLIACTLEFFLHYIPQTRDMCINVLVVAV